MILSDYISYHMYLSTRLYSFSKTMHFYKRYRRCYALFGTITCLLGLLLIYNSTKNVRKVSDRSQLINNKQTKNRSVRKGQTVNKERPFYNSSLTPDEFLMEYRNRCLKNEQKNNTINKLDICPCIPPQLAGKLSVDIFPHSWEDLNQKHRYISNGTHSPSNCVARQRIAIIIPYKDREDHLKVLLNHIHPLLHRQQAAYSLFVVEPIQIPIFNKAMLFNIGVLEIQKYFRPDCFIFSDVDQLLEDDRQLYRCDTKPIHLASHASQYNYRLLPKMVGGALALTPKQYAAVNGYSNSYWGWGKEDDDLFYRFRSAKINVERYPVSVSRYLSLHHNRDLRNHKNPFNSRLLNMGKSARKGNKWYSSEGLSTTNYTVRSIQYHQLYIHLIVEPDTPLSTYMQVTSHGPCSESHNVTFTSITECALQCTQDSLCTAFGYNMTYTQSMTENCFLKHSLHCKEVPFSDDLKYFERL